jgi:hypothetical protein
MHSGYSLPSLWTQFTKTNNAATTSLAFIAEQLRRLKRFDALSLPFKLTFAFLPQESTGKLDQVCAKKGAQLFDVEVILQRIDRPLISLIFCSYIRFTAFISKIIYYQVNKSLLNTYLHKKENNPSRMEDKIERSDRFFVTVVFAPHNCKK